MTTTRIALVGDYDPESIPHRAIPRAFDLTKNKELDWVWVHSSQVLDAEELLAGFHGIWCVPGSPYASTRGVLSAIRFARETDRPFLGTCGGFQHALLEYAEAVWGLDVTDGNRIIAPLACALDQQPAEIQIEKGTRLAKIYATDKAIEDYHCSYGLNPVHAWRLGSGALRVAARDAEGEVRAIELDGHRFYVATLFQPERASLVGRTHPLICAFVAACADAATA